MTSAVKRTGRPKGKTLRNDREEWFRFGMECMHAVEAQPAYRPKERKTVAMAIEQVAKRWGVGYEYGRLAYFDAKRLCNFGVPPDRKSHPRRQGVRPDRSCEYPLAGENEAARRLKFIEVFGRPPIDPKVPQVVSYQSPAPHAL